MAKIYKIKKGNEISVKAFILKDAKRLKEAYHRRGINIEIIEFKDNVKVFDVADSGSVEYFREEKEIDGKKESS
jgi:hypothetical protein